MLQGMEFLIKEAFIHIEGLGPHVAEGHYDLLGPHGEIILPHVWETVIEPDWTITMHMWPMTEEKEEEAPAEDAEPDITVVEEGTLLRRQLYLSEVRAEGSNYVLSE